MVLVSPKTKVKVNGVWKKTPEYLAWSRMKDRCYNPSNASYKWYSGRIKVCERWLNSSAAFLIDMGKRPSPIHSLDRIDNDGDYEPSNYKWSTPHEQSMNRRKRVYG